MSPGATQPDQVSAQAIDAFSKAAFGDPGQCQVIQRDAVEPCPRLGAALAQGGLRFSPLRAERRWIGVEIQATADDLPALGGQGLPAQRHIEAEAVE